MKSFITFLKESTEGDKGAKLEHIDHFEDGPLLRGSNGFAQSHAALLAAHEHIKRGENNSRLKTKFDGSPSIVYGHHPTTGEFFVATKSAFNKTPKINYTHKDIEKNHGHAPGLVSKLKDSLDHLRKVTPKRGVYQGDVMFSHGDVHNHE